MFEFWCEQGIHRRVIHIDQRPFESAMNDNEVRKLIPFQRYFTNACDVIAEYLDAPQFKGVETGKREAERIGAGL